MTLKLPAQVEVLCAQLEQAGFEAYVVGGATRDLLRGAVPKDYDVATSATPQEVQGIFTKTIPTGIKYGTITVIIDEMPIEVTTFRSDGAYDDKRRPTQVTFSKDIEEDLSRRDFTINAIAYRPVTMQIADPLDGQKDLQDKIIRCVGWPSERFSEDPLRMMRALRFLAVLPGFSIDFATHREIDIKKTNIRTVAQERIWQELGKMLMGEQASKAMEVIFSTGLAYEILAKGFDLHSSAKDSLIAHFDDLPKNLSTRLAGFCLIFGYSATKFASDFKRMDAKTVTRALDLLKVQYFRVQTKTKEERARRWIREVGKNSAEDAIELYFCAGIIRGKDKKLFAEQLAQNHPLTVRELAIGGEKLRGMCGDVGGWVGDTQRFLLDAVLKKPENNSEPKLTKLAKKHIESIPKNIEIHYASGDATVWVGSVVYARIDRKGEISRWGLKAIPELDSFIAKLSKTHQDLWAFMAPICKKRARLEEQADSYYKTYVANQTQFNWNTLGDLRKELYEFNERFVAPFLDDEKYYLAFKNGFWVKTKDKK